VRPQPGSQRLGVKIEPQFCKCFRLQMDARIVDCAQTSDRQATQGRVLGDDQIRQERQLLKDGRDAKILAPSWV
jgi:hypothetical protein